MGFLIVSNVTPRTTVHFLTFSRIAELIQHYIKIYIHSPVQKTVLYSTLYLFFNKVDASVHSSCCKSASQTQKNDTCPRTTGYRFLRSPALAHFIFFIDFSLPTSKPSLHVRMNLQSVVVLHFRLAAVGQWMQQPLTSYWQLEQKNDNLRRRRQ